jgi:hypothetical protein
MVRSLLNFPELPTFRVALRPGVRVAVQLDEPPVRLQVGPQVRQVHGVIPPVMSTSSRGANAPGSLRLKWSEAIRGPDALELRVVSTTLHNPSSGPGTLSPRLFPHPVPAGVSAWLPAWTACSAPCWPSLVAAARSFFTPASGPGVAAADCPVSQRMTT